MNMLTDASSKTAALRECVFCTTRIILLCVANSEISRLQQQLGKCADDSCHCIWWKTNQFTFRYCLENHLKHSNKLPL